MKLLEKHFEIAFAASDGIKKMRELILTMAMQGKLVPQNPTDQPASELLREMEAEKQQLVKAGKIKAQSLLPTIKPEEIPYELPRGWEWVRLGGVGETQTGTTPPKKDNNNFGDHIPFIGPGDMKNYSIDYCGGGLSDIGLSKGRLIKKNSVLMVCIGGSIGKHAINDRDITCNQQINTITPYQRDSVKYLFLAMGSQLFQKAVVSKASGSATPIINKHKWSSIPIPLPPADEQRRIVAKIEQLMARCDEMEKLRAGQQQKRLSVHNAALNRLLTATANDSFSASWNFIAQNFDDIYSSKENVAELRKAISQLAVMGKLVPQNPKDQPVRELLKEIETEKMLLAKQGKIKLPKPLPEIMPGEAHYVLPKSWVWARLGELIELISGQHLTPNEYNENGKGIPYYTGPADFGVKNPKSTRWTMVERAVAIEGDILLTVKGAGVGKTNVLSEKKAAISRQLMALRSIKINKDFLFYFLSTIFDELQGLSTGIAIPGIGREDVMLRRFPLPPLAEQHRIVAKIDQLIALCDKLEKQIDDATSEQIDLLNAVVAQV